MTALSSSIPLDATTTPRPPEEEQQPQNPPQPILTSTTAPGRVFASRAELAAHYQTAWHRYNLKRREAGLPVLLQADFDARWAAAQAVHTERTQGGGKKRNNHNHQTTQQSPNQQHPTEHQQQQQGGTDHLKQGKSRKAKPENESDDGPMTEAKNEDSNEPNSREALPTTGTSGTSGSSSIGGTENANSTTATIPIAVEIDPRQCLFDRHTSLTVASNVARMHRKYGFFVPDREFLSDLEGLIGYCHEKIQLGAVCLYCHRTFRTPRSCQQHMRSKIHTKLCYQVGVDLEDLDVFYDFAEADEAFWKSTGKAKKPMLEEQQQRKDNDGDVMEENDGVEDDDDDVGEDGGDADADWEDVSDDEDGVDDDDNMDDDNGEKEMYEGYEEEVARMGFNVTALGELVFPDGRIVGHRGLRRYYKQRLPQHKETSAAVSAAREAAGERLYRGRVYQIGNGSSSSSASASNNNNSSMDNAKNNHALVMAGIAPGIAAGRAGRGILVSGGGATYSQVSVYRYRAAVRKQRRMDRAGQMIIQRTTTNMNRMDKKANRLINNVSVAHAPR